MKIFKIFFIVSVLYSTFAYAMDAERYEGLVVLSAVAGNAYRIPILTTPQEEYAPIALLSFKKEASPEEVLSHYKATIEQLNNFWKNKAQRIANGTWDTPKK
ncbi:MAG: hypothetical protein WC707_05935 [Candidatus Babeliaceae bacterium]|jgi:hypothetical protein